MTIVELYDDKPINNIVGALAFEPDRIVYVGSFSHKQFMRYKLPVLRKYLETKGMGAIEVEFVQVRRDSLHDIVDKLEQIYRREGTDCRFNVEVTGGEDLILIALGILCDRHPEIQLFQISTKLRNIRSYSLSEERCDKWRVDCRNTVEENLILHGASVVSANGEAFLEGGFSWDDEFLEDMSVMWDIMCNGVCIEKEEGISYPYHWNRVCSGLKALDSYFEMRPDINLIQVKKDYFMGEFLKDYSSDVMVSYLECLSDNGIIEYTVGREYVYIEFKNDQIRLCLTNEGLLLELKTYMICMDLMEERGGDCLTGVNIDWDGDDDLSAVKPKFTADDDDELVISTMNEVDVLATSGLVPYFISCKNGMFTSEELYKLNSVGERFGCGYSKKIIVTTNLSFALGSGRSIMLQRAQDMGIEVVENVHELRDWEFAERLAAAMELPKEKAAVQ